MATESLETDHIQISVKSLDEADLILAGSLGKGIVMILSFPIFLLLAVLFLLLHQHHH